jgi:soluble lytic murein transglycosylase
VNDAAKLTTMKRFIGIVLLISPPAWSSSAYAAGHPEDATFLQARDAFSRGERAKLANALAGLKTHPLIPWATYFQLNQRLEDGADTGVGEFLERNEGAYVSEKLRGDWLKWLMRKEDWPQARIQFALLQRPDGEATCRGLDVRQRLGEAEVSEEARKLLATAAPLAGSCLPPLGRLAASGKLSADDLWERLRRQLANGKLKEARAIAGWLPADETPAWRTVESIDEHPAKYVAKLPEHYADSRRGRELVSFAVLRMARTDAHLAAERWKELERHFSKPERGFVWGRLALIAATAHQPDAVVWFDQAETLAGKAQLDEEQAAWRVRAALRAGKWPDVQRALAAMPDTQAALPEWRYWQARAHAALGKPEEAKALYAEIAGQPNFYGILAGEALGKTHTPPPRATTSSAEELAEAGARPGLVRGLALIRADMRIEGIREWNWTLNGLNDRQLLAAAELARRNDVIDRSINTADRTVAEHDYSLRYPTPFLTQVEPKARDVGLDTAWVYGLMRQESRFITEAKSSVGAKGLMQLMPATAKWVAKKIGMSDYQPTKVTEMDINVTLGTNYMKMVLDSLDSHPVLASAAYNAGPGRARKWRAERPLEGAIYAESIPFNETRDYVKKVMANAMSYAVLMGGPTPTLTSRLGMIRPRNFGDRSAEDLP